MIILEAKDILVKFGERIFFSDLDFQIRKNQKIIIDGKVGSGKSLFMKLISGLFEPNKGSVLYYGKPFHYFLDKRFFNERRSICYLLEGLEPLANLNVYENLALYYQMNTRKSEEEIRSIVYKKLIKVNLDDKMDLRPSFLSMEERVILNILMNIKEGSEIYIIDEIFTFLNESIQEKIKRVIQKELEGKELTLIMSKADHDILETGYDSFCVIDNKRIVEANNGK